MGDKTAAQPTLETPRRTQRLVLTSLILIGLILISLTLAGLTLAGLALTAAGGDSNNAVPTDRVCFVCGTDDCRSLNVADCTTAGAQTPETTRDPRPTAGEIDLTGDGIPEKIRRTGSDVAITQNEITVWQSPDNWDIVDMALGDPNDDGRGELFLAFWRDDDKGIAQSHPFIIGYRGGIYRTLWGGSAVRDAIQEIELADMDGDGTQELVVLETSDAGQSAVTFWQWHGWGFSLQWRSEPGLYRDMVILPGQSSTSGIISVTRVPSPGEL